MKTWLLAATVVLALPRLGSSADVDNWTPLFNGKDLTGLKVQYKDADRGADPAKTFTVKDGALIVSGKPTCYIHTDKSYQNYVLTYEWRFPKGSSPESNSGCLIHIQDPPKVMPKSIEPQGRYKDHGKLFFMGVKGTSEFDEAAHKKALKPMGEWSTTEVTCKPDGTISVKLNGIPVASGKTELTSGPIAFQCEGWEVHFRNIKIKELK